MTQVNTAPQGYQPGGVYGICDRCAFKRRLRALATEWTGLKVCSECFDLKPESLSRPNIYPEGQPVRGSRPDPGDTLGPNTTTAADLIP